MLPSFVSNFFWGVAPSAEQDGSKAEETKEELHATEVKHTTHEEEGWLLVTRSRESAGSTSGNSNGQECDLDSMCSEGSWVVTPSTTFTETNAPSSDTFHPMEDLLIEHPTMSVYQQNQPTNNTGHGEELDARNNDLERLRQERQALVLLRNRRRHEVATQLQVPQVEEEWVRPPNPGGNKPPRLTRRALKRQNVNTYRGGKPANRVQQMSRKPGRRRC